MSKEQGGKSFIKHFMVIGSGTLINMLLGLLTTPVITRIVEPTEYGQLSIFNLYVSIAVMVLCLGLDQAFIRFFYDHDSIIYKRKLLALCFIIPFIFSIICGGILILISRFSSIKWEFSTLITYLLAFNIIICIWNRFSVLLLRMNYDSKFYSVCNVIQKIVYVVSALVLLKLIKQEYLTLLVIATVLSYAVPSIVATFRTRDYWKISKAGILSNWKEIILYGMPLILSMGLTTLFQAQDKLFLNYFCSYSEVGIYSSAMSLISVFSIIQTTFNSLWSPMQVEHYVTNPDDTRFIEKGNSYITLIMFFIGFSLILVKNLFVLLLGNKYREAAYIMPFLIFNPIMCTISETTCSGIGVSKKSYLNIWVAIGAFLSNAIGNLILIPICGCKGAAISTGVSYIVFWALRTFFSNKYYYVNYHLKKTIILIFLGILYALYNTFREFDILSIIGYLFCVGVMLFLYKDTLTEIVRYVLMFIRKKLNL